jgi:hypothetical protein
MHTFDIINLTTNPWELLGISQDADDSEIEAAWENLSNANRKNDRLRQAYQLIANRGDRAKFKLLSPHEIEDPLEILQDLPPGPKYAGPGIWYKSLSAQLISQSED